jgi:hypothetical protein
MPGQNRKMKHDAPRACSSSWCTMPCQSEMAYSVTCPLEQSCQKSVVLLSVGHFHVHSRNLLLARCRKHQVFDPLNKVQIIISCVEELSDPYAVITLFLYQDYWYSMLVDMHCNVLTKDSVLTMSQNFRFLCDVLCHLSAVINQPYVPVSHCPYSWW